MSEAPISLYSSLSTGVILSVKVYVPVEKQPEFFKFFRPAYDAVIAEPECRFFFVTQNPQEPEAISWVEGWTKGVEWLQEVQLKKPYYQPYIEATEPWFSKPREIGLSFPKEGLVNFKLPEGYGA